MTSTEAESTPLAPEPTTTQPRSRFGRLGAIARKIGSKGGWALFDQAVVSGTNFLAIVLVGKACLPEELAVYALGVSLLVLASTVQHALVTSPLVVYGAKLDEAGRSALNGSALLHSAVLGGTASAACLIAALAFWLLSFSQEFVILALLLAATVPLVLLRDYFRRLEFSRGQFRAACGYDSFVSGVWLAWLIVLLWLGRLGPISGLLGMTVACAAANLLRLLTARDGIEVRREQVWPDWQKHFAFGSWGLASNMVAFASGYLPQWLLWFTEGRETAGVWAACMSLVQLTNPIVIGVSNMLGPRAAHVLAAFGPSALKRFTLRATLAVAVIMLPFAVALTVLGPWGIELLFGKAYSEHHWTVALLAWAVLLRASGMPASEALSAIERPRLNLSAGWAGLALAGIAALLLIPPWLLLGAAWAFLLGNFITAAARAFLLTKVAQVMSREHENA